MTLEEASLRIPKTMADTRATIARTGSSFRFLMRFLEQAAPGAAKRLCLGNLIVGLASVAVPYVTMRLVESVTAAQKSGQLWSPLLWLAAEAGVVVLRTVAAREIAHQAEVLEAKGQTCLTSAILSKACEVAYGNFEQQKFVDELARARESTSDGVPFMLEVLAILRTVVIFAGSLSLLLVGPIWLLLLVAIVALPAHLMEVRFAGKRFGIELENTRRSRQRWYLEWLITSEWTAKEVRVFNAGDWLVSMYRDICRPVVAGRVALAQNYRASALAYALFGIVARYGPYVYIVLQTIQGRLSLGAMLLVTMAFQMCGESLNQLLGSLAAALGKELRVRGAIEFLNRRREPELVAGDEPLLDAAPELVVEDLWFAYPGRPEPVLRGLNLRVRAGETLAIVGSNGAGKTTLVKVLLGLYPAQRGRVLLAGIDVSARSTAWRQRNIGVVFQDFARFQFSAMENVGIGWLDDAADEGKVWSALAKAGAEPVVRDLSRGLHTALGPAFGGHDLSGGQWQRIALARLFMRRSRLWILDEPSAAMDPETEEHTFRGFPEWMSGRTAVIISHRLSSVLMASRIAVIHEGRVVELGSHDELVSRGGRYTQLFPALRRTEGIRGVAM